jgi:hypothetical protein
VANAVLTRTCDGGCAFCFADNDGSMPMDLEALSALADQLRSEGMNTLALLGGEPTAHPQFSETIAVARRLGMNLRVFSHGFMDASALSALVEMGPDWCHVVINANAWFDRIGSSDSSAGTALAELGARASFGVTFSPTAPSWSHLWPSYSELGLRRHLRIGLAQPLLGATNAGCVDYRMRELGTCITELAVRAAEHGLDVEFDCGFVLCMFSAAERRQLAEHRVVLRSVCGAVPDIAPGNQAWPCYALSRCYRAPYHPHQSLSALRCDFNRRLRGFRVAGLYPECRVCEWFADGSCNGGCLARVIGTFAELAG